MDEGTKQGLNTMQSWLSPQPPKRKAASQLYLFEVTAQEKEIIESGLRECQGRVFGPAGAAVELGIPRSTLESKIRALKINKIASGLSRELEDPFSDCSYGNIFQVGRLSLFKNAA